MSHFANIVHELAGRQAMKQNGWKLHSKKPIKNFAVFSDGGTEFILRDDGSLTFIPSDEEENTFNLSAAELACLLLACSSLNGYQDRPAN